MINHNDGYLNRVSAARLSLQKIAMSTSRPSDTLSLNGVQDKIIDGIEIKNAKFNCIRLVNCSRVTIKNCRLLMARGNGVDIYKSQYITVENCYIENAATGVYALESQHININHNIVKNVQGPLPRGQMVQFDEVTGTANRVTDNRCENIPGESHPEDAINMYKTSGTISDPVKITGNLIRGGGPSVNGGGIMLGDNGGGHLIAAGNILVNPGAYGIGISSGTDIQVIDNMVYSKQQPFSNVGIYVWNQSSTACLSNVISGNKVNWTNAKGEVNGGWDNGNCGPVTGWETNTWNAAINASIIAEDFLKR
jgi:parallel beta-helix repeat protein